MFRYRHFWIPLGLAALLLLGAAPCRPQYSATLFVQPFPSPYPGDWQTNPTIAYLTATNSTGLPGSVRVTLRISRNSDGVQILSGTSNVLIIPPSPPATILNNTQFLDLSNVTYDGSFRNKVITTGRLPEGEYLACADLKDPGGKVLVSNVCSQPFTVVYPSSPTLLYPANEDSLIQQYPVFQWTPTTAPPAFAIHYHLKMVEMLPGQVPAQALASTSLPQYEDQNITATNLVYPLSALILKEGSTYAWWVQALDQNNSPATTNNGYSEIFTFTYKGTPIIPPTPPKPIAATPTLSVESPEEGSSWKPVAVPQFKLKLEPAINSSGLSHGQLRIWEMDRKGQASDKVMAGTPLVTTEFDSSSTLVTLTTPDSGSTILTWRLDTSRADQHFKPSQGKWYMWKVDLSVDSSTIRADGARCPGTALASEATSFKCDTSAAESDSGACKDVCSIDPPSDQDPYTGTFNPGDSIKAGRFTMVITEVQGTGFGLSGKGEIAISLLNARLVVEFNGIRVNKSKQMIDGEIKGSQSKGSPLTDAEANNLGSALDLSKEKIEAIHTLASSAERAVTGLSGASAVSLPLGLDNVIGGERYVIGIIGIVFKPTAAYLNAAIAYPLSDLGQDIGVGLGARDICFSPDGFGGNGLVTLYLAEDLGYRNDDSWSFAFLAPKSGEKGCYITFDCHGFKQFHLSAAVQFPRTWLRPYPTDDGTSKVTATFETTVGRGGNFLVSAGIDECEITSAPGFVMQVKDLTFDHSSEENPDGIVFPSGYNGTKDKTWTGFFIKKALISLPPQLRTFDASQPPQVVVENLLINKSGLTGNFRAENVFMYPHGNFGEWGGSLDTLGVNVVNSSLTRGWLTGRIKMPIAEAPVRYTATLARPSTDDTSRTLSYAFVLQPDSTLTADLWKAKISLSSASSITIGNDNAEKKLVASAVLSGNVSIAGNIGGLPNVDLPGIEFQDLKLQTVSPYFQNGTWSFASPEKKLAGFPISISHISLENTQRDGKELSGLKFTVSVNLSPGTSAVSGGTTLTLWGALDKSSTGHVFSFYGVDLDSIGVNADLGPVSVVGYVNFYREDSVFGTGFRGQVNADILKRIAVTSTVQFGQVGGFRYFYVDAKGAFNPGIAFGTTGVGFYGLGGGFWWNMKREGTADPEVPTSCALAGSPPGATASGMKFVPSEGAFGFKAMVVLGTYPSPVSFNADVAMEVELQQTSTGVSIGRITLEGNGYMMAGLTEREKAKVTCAANIAYDFPTSTLHGVFAVDIHASPITGSGQMVVHIEPSTWYMKIGEPSSRITLRLADWLTTDAYLMIGKSLPPPPAPPQRVIAILGSPSTTRDSRIAAGDGFAFGASVSFSTGRQYYLIFYGDVSAGGGFDIALLNQKKCPGINGWQAQGQLYAYVDASVGLHVDIGFYTYYPCGHWWCYVCKWCRNGYVGYRGDYEILGVHAAALLAAGGPNPLWVNGTVAGNYSILGGLVKGSCSFKFSKGTECTL